MISSLLRKFFHVAHFLPANFGAVMLIECCVLLLTNNEKG